MNITKDEARILSSALSTAKYELNHKCKGSIYKLEELEERLYQYGKDKRRTGRTSFDNFYDCIERYCKRNK